MTPLWIFLVCALLRTEAFSVQTQTRRSAHGTAFWHPSSLTIRSAFPDIDKTASNDGGGNEFSDFNPFSYQTDKNKKSSLDNYAGTQISLRKTTMQALINELLDTVQDPEQMQAILQANRDFLLETIEEKEAVLDSDSVYTFNMSRAERYQAYRNVMQERLSTAKNPAVRQVLTALYDFVTSHE
jgi:hypothetical protein